MLALRCEFLNGTYQAAMPGSTGEPEWPPHPARLHAALVAAGWAIGGKHFPDDARAALSWLERLPAPTLAPPTAVGTRTLADVYVPRNLTSAETRDLQSALRAGRDASRQSGRVSRRFPTSVPGDQPVWLIWTEDHPKHRRTLQQLAREVQYLGSSRSPVCCDVADDPPAATFIPVTPGDAAAVATSLRIAGAGFTERLLGNRGIYPPPTVGVLTPYRHAEGQVAHEEETSTGPFGELVALAFDRAFPLTILHAPLVARAFREAVLAHAGDDAPAVLHGHGCDPHVAFLPLANVGHPHASGQIVGIATAIPRSVDDRERAQIVAAVSAVSRLSNLGLGANWQLRPANARALFALAPSRWAGPARRWQTVTPVILDRHPKTRSRDAFERALRSTFAHALVPTPESLDWSEIPWQPAAVPAPAYRGQGLPSGLRVHVDVTFERPLRGPLLVGRGRYFGVGLFAPVRSHDDPGSDDG